MNTQLKQSIDEKLAHLSEQRVAEVLDFVDFLEARERSAPPQVETNESNAYLAGIVFHLPIKRIPRIGLRWCCPMNLRLMPRRTARALQSALQAVYAGSPFGAWQIGPVGCRRCSTGATSVGPSVGFEGMSATAPEWSPRSAAHQPGRVLQKSSFFKEAA